MQADYTPFIGRMIDRYEGGYCWDKADPGGPTKYGITCYDLAEHRGQKMSSMSVWAPIVHDMQRSEAEDIYRDKYAKRIKFDDLNPGVDCCMMDYGVNSGYARAIRVACALVNVPQTSTMTPELLGLINKRDPVWFVESMCKERLHFMHQIRNGSAWAEFGKGWGARVADLEQYCKAVIKNAPAEQAPDLSKVSTPKASHVDPQVATKTVQKGTVATSGAGATSFAGVPWYVIAGGVAVIVIGGIVYVIYKHRKAQHLDATVTLPPTITGVAHAA